MPTPEDLIRKLGGSRFFSKIDLADAYNQIRLAPESQRKLALSSTKGVLLQTRLPFGISSAPGYFQQIMENLTADIKGVVVYLDDMLLGGSTAEEHLENLKWLFQRLRDKGLKCNKSKCVFAQTSLEYLGHTLSNEGIKKGGQVEALVNMPHPTNVSSLKSFLGSIQFYHKFLPNLATIVEPLTRSTRKFQKWQWTFQHLKNALVKEVTLSHFDASLPLGLTCDASEVGIGVILFHRYNEGSERPIAHASKTLTTVQLRYSEIQKEAFAINYGLHKFHQYLYGRRFILVTDHKPLLGLFDPMKGTPTLAVNRLTRWALTLSQCDYSIENCKTQEHGNVDALSRLPVEDTNFDQMEEDADLSTVLQFQ